MMPFMLVISVVLLAILLLAAALRPARSALSLYELRRRQVNGDKAAAQALRREGLLAQAAALRPAVTGFLLVGMTLALVAALGWAWGAVAAAVVAVFYGRAAGLSLLRTWSRRLYRPRERAVLGFLGRHKKRLGLLTGKVQPAQPAAAFSSREELDHLIAESGDVLPPGDKKLLTHALAFTDRRAGDVMTPRENVVAVEHTELLGPLVLSDLHKTGHSSFPVIAGGLDHIAGILDIRGLLTLEAKRSVTAAKAMTGQAFYIRRDQTLDHALAAFVRTRSHLLIVIDEQGATLGLLSLRDVLEALFGRPMADEFAGDNDVRSVAGRDLSL